MSFSVLIKCTTTSARLGRESITGVVQGMVNQVRYADDAWDEKQRREQSRGGEAPAAREKHRLQGTLVKVARGVCIKDLPRMLCGGYCLPAFPRLGELLMI